MDDEWKQEVANDDMVFTPRCPCCFHYLVVEKKENRVKVYCQSCHPICMKGAEGRGVIEAHQKLRDAYVLRNL